MNFRIAGFVAIATTILAIQADAHHSFAMFDHEKMITVTGTLKEFEYTNPHCWLHVSAVDPANGRTVEWAFEMGCGPGRCRRLEGGHHKARGQNHCRSASHEGRIAGWSIPGRKAG